MKNLLLLIFLFSIIGATAQETDAEDKAKQSNNWEYIISPNLWLADVEADLSFFSGGVPYSVEYTGLFTDLESGFQIEGEVRKGKLLALAGASFLRVKEFGAITNVEGRSQYTLNQNLAEGFIGYTVFNAKDAIFIDALAGVRHFELDHQIEVGSRNFFSRFDSYTDPVIGARLRAESKWFNATVRADVGGFGVGSDISWKSSAVFELRFVRQVGVNFGFQAFGLQGENEQRDAEPFEIDITTAGLLFGVNVYIN